MLHSDDNFVRVLCCSLSFLSLSAALLQGCAFRCESRTAKVLLCGSSVVVCVAAFRLVLEDKKWESLKASA